MKKPIFIAEIKTQSPFGFKSDYSFHGLMECAIKYGDWISVHTNPLWGGSFDAIEYVRRFTNKPILAKGFHSKDEDIRNAIVAGANYVLVVDRIPEYNFRADCCLHELGKNIQDIPQLYADKPLKYVYNGRDLNTGLPKSLSDYQKYRNKYEWICGASLIRHYSDVQRLYPNCDAFIVGENLVHYCCEVERLFASRK